MVRLLQQSKIDERRITMIEEGLTWTFYRVVKSSTSCVVNKCGSKLNLEFHHVNPRTKVDTVHSIARHGTVEQLITELRNCVPVCKDHHLMIHQGRIKGWLTGKFDNGKFTSDTSEAEKYMPFKPLVTGNLNLRAAPHQRAA